MPFHILYTGCMNKWIVHTPLGAMALVESGGKITHLFLQAAQAPAGLEEKQTPLLRRAAKELEAYFAGKRQHFDLPLAPEGTAFEQQVWKLLRSIPYGHTCTYGDLARRLNSPRAARAVGGACHRNPLPIFIPCHRVVGAGGKLTGYAGGLKRKRYLLEMENSQKAAL